MPDNKNRFTILEDEYENIETIVPKKNYFLKFIKTLPFILLLGLVYFFFESDWFSKIDKSISNLFLKNEENSEFKNLKQVQDILNEFYLPIGSKDINLAKCLNLYEKNFYKQAKLHCKEFSKNSLDKRNKSVSLTVLGVLSDKENDYRKAESYLKKALELDNNNVYALYNLTLVYKHIGDFVNARIFITKAKNLSPNDSKVSLLAGNLLNELNEPKNAIKSYEEGLKKDPNNSALIYNVALTKFKQGDIDNATLDFKRAASLGNGKISLDSYLYLGSIYFDKKDFNRSEQFFKQAVDLVPNSPKYLYNLSKVLFLQGKKQESLMYLKKSLISNVRDPVVYQSISFLALELGNYTLAIDSLEKGLRIKPDQIDLLFSIAELYKKKGDYLAAENSYQRIVELTPGDTFTQKALLDLSNLYQEIDRFGDSEEVLKKIIEINLRNDNAYYNLGVVYEYFQKFDLALKNWQKALEINPNNLNATESMADYYYKNFLYEKAENGYTSILKKNKNKFDVYLKLADVYLKQNRFVESQAVFQKIIEISKEQNYLKLAYRGLSRTYTLMGDSSNLQKAKKNAYLSIEVDSQDKKSRLFLAEILIKSGLMTDIENAIDELKIIIQSDVDSEILAKSYNYLGFCYHKRGDERSAIEQYQKALEIQPNFSEAYRNKQLSLSNLQKQNNNQLF